MPYLNQWFWGPILFSHEVTPMLFYELSFKRAPKPNFLERPCLSMSPLLIPGGEGGRRRTIFRLSHDADEFNQIRTSWKIRWEKFANVSFLSLLRIKSFLKLPRTLLKTFFVPRPGALVKLAQHRTKKNSLSDPDKVFNWSWCRSHV